MEALAPISNWILLAVGVALIVAEILTLTFILVFIGLGFVLTALVGEFIWPFDNATQQLLFMALVSFLLAFAFKSHLTRRFGPNAESIQLETLTLGEKGQLLEHDGQFRVNYKGTTYAVANTDEDDFQPGDTVLVTQLKNNQAWVKKPANATKPAH